MSKRAAAREEKLANDVERPLTARPHEAPCSPGQAPGSRPSTSRIAHRGAQASRKTRSKVAGSTRAPRRGGKAGKRQPARPKKPAPAEAYRSIAREARRAARRAERAREERHRRAEDAQRSHQPSLSRKVRPAAARPAANARNSVLTACIVPPSAAARAACVARTPALQSSARPRRPRSTPTAAATRTPCPEASSTETTFAPSTQDRTRTRTGRTSVRCFCPCGSLCGLRTGRPRSCTWSPAVLVTTGRTPATRTRTPWRRPARLKGGGSRRSPQPHGAGRLGEAPLPWVAGMWPSIISRSTRSSEVEEKERRRRRTTKHRAVQEGWALPGAPPPRRRRHGGVRPLPGAGSRAIPTRNWCPWLGDPRAARARETRHKRRSTCGACPWSRRACPRSENAAIASRGCAGECALCGQHVPRRWL